MGGDDFCVHACPVKGAAVTAVLHLDALVDDGDEASFDGAVGAREVDDAELEPDGFGAESYSVIDDGGNFGRRAEDLDEIDGDVDALEVGITLLAENLGCPWIHGNDGVALIKKVRRNHVARLRFLAGETNDGDRLGLAKELSDGRRVLELCSLLGGEYRVESYIADSA